MSSLSVAFEASECSNSLRISIITNLKEKQPEQFLASLRFRKVSVFGVF